MDYKELAGVFFFFVRYEKAGTSLGSVEYGNALKVACSGSIIVVF